MYLSILFIKYIYLNVCDLYNLVPTLSLYNFNKNYFFINFPIFTQLKYPKKIMKKNHPTTLKPIQPKRGSANMANSRNVSGITY